MDYHTYSKRLQYILDLIKRGGLSSPCDLTKKFECTEKTVRKMINDLRKEGHRIKYCRKRFKYFVENQ